MIINEPGGRPGGTYSSPLRKKRCKVTKNSSFCKIFCANFFECTMMGGAIGGGVPDGNARSALWGAPEALFMVSRGLQPRSGCYPPVGAPMESLPGGHLSQVGHPLRGRLVCAPVPGVGGAPRHQPPANKRERLRRTLTCSARSIAGGAPGGAAVLLWNVVWVCSASASPHQPASCGWLAQQGATGVRRSFGRGSRCKGSG